MTRVKRIIVDSVDYIYPGGTGAAVHSINCVLERGEIVALAGPTASGKSTLGRLVSGLIEPVRGAVYSVDSMGQHAGMKANERMCLVGIACAHPEIQLFAMTVGEDVAFGPRNQHIPAGDAAVISHHAMQAAGLDPSVYAKRHPYSLSSGERRRAAIAGIVALNRPFYVFDEPTSGLDKSGCLAFLRLLEKLREDNCGIIWITHELRLALKTADRIWGMQSGKLILDVKSDQVDLSTLKPLLYNNSIANN